MMPIGLLTGLIVAIVVVIAIGTFATYKTASRDVPLVFTISSIVGAVLAVIFVAMYIVPRNGNIDGNRLNACKAKVLQIYANNTTLSTNEVIAIAANTCD